MRSRHAARRSPCCLALRWRAASSGRQGPRRRRAAGGSVTVALAAAGRTRSIPRWRAHAGGAAGRLAGLHAAAHLPARRGAGAARSSCPGWPRRCPKSSDDGLTWKLTLRRACSYSNGRPLRAARLRARRSRARCASTRRALERFGASAARASSPGTGGAPTSPASPPTTRTGAVPDRARRSPTRCCRYALASPQAAPVPAGTRFDTRLRPRRASARSRSRRGGPAATFTPARASTASRSPGCPSGERRRDLGRACDRRHRAPRMRPRSSGRVDAAEGEAPVGCSRRCAPKYGTRYDEAPTLRVLHVRLDERRRPFSDPDARKAVSYRARRRALGRVWAGLLEPACNLIPPQLSRATGAPTRARSASARATPS